MIIILRVFIKVSKKIVIALKRFIKSTFQPAFMKCRICKKSMAETFLRKPIGTYVKDKKGKKHLVCNNCQRLGKKEIMKKL